MKKNRLKTMLVKGGLNMNIPKSCGECKYGHTYDMSIDDLCTKCMVTNYKSDWCSFPNRSDGTHRMRGCPLPNLTDNQIKVAEVRLKRYTTMRILLKKALKGKTKLIRKRNWSRINRLGKKFSKSHIQ